MDKKIVIGVGILLIVIIGIVAFSSITSIRKTGSVISGSTIGTEKLSEEERYAKLNAEFGCDALRSQEEKNVLNFTGNIEIYMEKYGFDVEQATSLAMKYASDVSFAQLVVNEMENFCPDVLAQIQTKTN